ncbi:hypothetical protein ASD28_04680 [Massilia sp. Root133]|uniref:hypothetical protein n=1 Tax=Massilia TaxID=149698 RepID=UPI0006FB164B|nr:MULTISPECIES: hypothetical protein [Telluria group]KQY11918.1 hypothetical protein ASD28_04680 [Massilia sp. Root133]KQZ34467.1 hypothetical protein ASD92_09230 [Massilia sp. Root1485]
MARTTAAKTPVKTAAKPAAKKAVATKAAPAKKVAAVKKAAVAPAKPVRAKAAPTPAKVAREAARAIAAPVKTTRAKAAPAPAVRPHLVRDSFTMPEQEYAVLATVKQACLKAGFEVKKSELLRMGVALLGQLDTASLRAVLDSLPQLKTGRPPGE